MAKVTSRREYKPSAPTLYLAFELGASQWKLGFSAGLGSTPLLRTVKAGDLLAVSQEIAQAKQRLALPAKARVLSCYEAGRDGFWLHRGPTDDRLALERRERIELHLEYRCDCCRTYRFGSS